MLNSAVKIRPAKKADIYPIANNMREMDARECMSMFLMRPLEALKDSFKRSDKVKVVIYNDKPVAMFGICSSSALTNYGVIWMLSTGVVDKHPFTVLKYLEPEIDEICKGYELVYNYVSVDNKGMLKALKKMKFQLSESQSTGVISRKFVKFVKEFPCV